MPLSSPLTMVRANTIEMQGKPGLTGDVGGMYLKITVLDVTNLKAGLPTYRSTYFAALGVGVWRSKHPSGSNVAVVSRCKASRSCPISVRQYCPL